jgi:hypothetical protein
MMDCKDSKDSKDSKGSKGSKGNKDNKGSKDNKDSTFHPPFTFSRAKEEKMLGIRLLSRLPAEAEYAEDYTVVWTYEGPNPREALVAMLDTTELKEPLDYVVQIKKWECGSLVWKTVDLLEP